MLLYFNRAPFMLAHCLIDAICLHVFEKYLHFNYCITVFIYLCIYFYIFLNSFVVFFGGTTLETCMLLCALMCLSSVNIIYIYIYMCIIMFYQINSLTHLNRGETTGCVVLQAS